VGNTLVGTDLVVIDGDTFQLQVIVSFVKTILVDTVLVGNDLPEVGTYGRESKIHEFMSMLSEAHRFGYHTIAN
jgi:hypothetical protein